MLKTIVLVLKILSKKKYCRNRKGFQAKLADDSCTVRSIHMAVNDITAGNMSNFNLIYLHVLHKNANGYASEYLVESMNKVVRLHFKTFLKKIFVMDTHHTDIKLAALVSDVSPFIQQHMPILIKKYLIQLPASEIAYKKYFIKAINRFTIRLRRLTHICS